MPAKVKVRILAGRNLPVMDKSSDASDAFVEVKLGNTTYKTEVYRRSLNPFWNSEWFRFEVSDQELQDEPLQIRIMDYDTYSANDAIGKVYINLNPLLINPGRSMSGWLPIYDTLHGIRGEINCMVKVNLFADNNRYRHSSCGVRFFFSDIPNGYKCDAILGFVDELLVNDDPEYQWIDKIRTPRASNEARQTLFTKLSGEVQRKLGLKAEVFGGNAVIGYQQSFDLEGSSGIVGRGIGTAVVLSKLGSPYEGIISPVQMNDQNAPHPYFVDGYRRNHHRQDRSNRSYYIPKNNHPERHLVHSISADYFYEVPSILSAAQTKRLSTNLSETPLNQQLPKQLTRSNTANSETTTTQSEDDESEYEDCEETLSQNSDLSSIDDGSNDREQSGLSSHRQSKKSSLSSLGSSYTGSSLERRGKKKLFRLTPSLLLGGRSLIVVDSNTRESLRNKIFSQSSPDSSLADTLTSSETATAASVRSNSILKKIRQSNEIISQTVSNVTKPIASNSTKLTKLLSLRRPATSSNRHHQPVHHGSSLNEAAGAQTSSKQLHHQTDSGGASSIINFPEEEEEASKASTSGSVLLTTLKPIGPNETNETNQHSTEAFSSLPSASSNATTAATILKRRRDKSQSASLEDALSIIEEKLDDDECNQRDTNQDVARLTATTTGSELNINNSLTAPPPSIVRARSSGSASSTKYQRPMLRTKEIDLRDGDGDDHDDVDGHDVDDENMIDVVDDGADIDEGTPSSVTLDDGLKEAASESLLSSSSPSTSVLTDDTVKARDLSTPSTPQNSKTKQNSSSNLGISNDRTSQSATILHRSDTDLTRDIDEPTTVGKEFTSFPSSGVKTSSSSQSVQQSTDLQMKSSSPDFNSQKTKDSNDNQLGGSSSNFVQSVKTVRAQQHLLQNIIRNQNQNLLYSSTNKAKNAFMYPNRVHQSEYPFVTLKKYPPNMIQCTGGVVSVHSVKLLDHIINDEESETRDVWWTEIRKEIRSHAKALNCNTILGYSETSKVIGDVCVLSACGTAAILRSAEQLLLASRGEFLPTTPPFNGAGSSNIIGQNVNSRSPTNFGGTNNITTTTATAHTLKVPRLSASPPPSHSSMPPPPPSNQTGSNISENSKETIRNDQNNSPSQSTAIGCSGDFYKPTNIKSSSTDAQHQQQPSSSYVGRSSGIDCSLCHTSLACVESVASLANCTICGQSKVPDVLLLTIEPPQNLNIASAISLVQARVCRAKRDAHGEANAKEIGEALPFLEYELHRQLFTKLKFKGMNCLFDLSVDISVGENMITGLATGTGCFVLGLPEPEPPQISAGKGIQTSKLNEIQQLISLSAMRNRELLGIGQIRERLASYHNQRDDNNKFSLASSPRPMASGINASSGYEFLPGKSIVNGSLKNQLSHNASSSADVPSSIDLPSHSAEDHSNDMNRITGMGSNLLKSSTSSEFHQPLTTALSLQHRSSRHHSNHHHRHHHNHHQNHKRSPLTADTTTENLLSLLTDDNNIVLEVDDNEDADIIAQLIDNDVPKGYLICNCESLPTIDQSSILSINMFTQVMRVKLSGLEQFSQQFEWILQALFVKLRRSLPCCLTNINFVVDLPETNVIQISVTGCLLGLSLSPEALEMKYMEVIENDQPSTSTQQQPLQQQQHSVEDKFSSLNQAESSQQLLRQLKANNQQKQHQHSHQHHTSTSASMLPNSITACSSSSSLTSTPSTTTPAPSSSSSSTSSSSSSSSSSSDATSSPASSSVSSKRSSSHKSQSVSKKQSKESSAAATTIAASGSSAPHKGETIAKSITKQLSKTNIAALISGKKRLPSSGETTEDNSFELPIRGSGQSTTNKDGGSVFEPAATRAAVLAAMKESQQQTSASIRPTTSVTTTLAGQQQQQQQQGQPITTSSGTSRTAMIRSMRAVFKKQQTYPGATSPQISGQDRLLPSPLPTPTSDKMTITGFQTALINSNSNDGQPIDGQTISASLTTATTTTPASNATRRATNILNKVKQPLKDLGSNFNTSNSSSSRSPQTMAGQANDDGGQQQTSALSNLASAAANSSATSGNGGSTGQKSKIMSLGHHRSSSARVPSSRTTSRKSPSHLITSASSSHVTGLESVVSGVVGEMTTTTTKLPASGGVGATSGAIGTAAQKAMQTIAATTTSVSATTTSNNDNNTNSHHHNHHQNKKLASESSSAANSSIDITSLSYIPGAKEYHYLGNLSFSFVRETNSVRENGGLNGFIHCFLMEVYAIVRAHVSALGGNAFLSFRLQQSCIFYHSNKNQAQCLISVAGDAVQVAL